VAVFMASPDSDPGATTNPLDAMALAPAEALIEPKRSLPAAQPATRPAKASAAEKTDKEGAKPSPSKAGSTKPICRESFGEAREGDCIRARIVRVRPSTAVNERPLIAAAPIGRREILRCFPRRHQPQSKIVLRWPRHRKSRAPSQPQRRQLLLRQRLLTRPLPPSPLLHLPLRWSCPRSHDREFITCGTRHRPVGAIITPTGRVTARVVPSIRAADTLASGNPQHPTAYEARASLQSQRRSDPRYANPRICGTSQPDTGIALWRWSCQPGRHQLRLNETRHQSRRLVGLISATSGHASLPSIAWLM